MLRHRLGRVRWQFEAVYHDWQIAGRTYPWYFLPRAMFSRGLKRFYGVWLRWRLLVDWSTD